MLYLEKSPTKDRSLEYYDIVTNRLNTPSYGMVIDADNGRKNEWELMYCDHLPNGHKLYEKIWRKPQNALKAYIKYLKGLQKELALMVEE